jgi:predicted transcriptional regulator
MTTISSAADLAELLMRIRVEAGWTVERLAHKVETSQPYMSMVTTGKRTPRVPMLLQILDAQVVKRP